MKEIKKRKITNVIVLSFSFITAVIGIFWLFFILYDVLKHGFSALSLSLFVNDPGPPGLEGGGLRNAFLGQLLISLIAILVGIPTGILGGIFLAEYGRRSVIGKFISILSDIMISIPTIIIGTFIYTIMVKPMGHFSGWAGAISLAFIIIPVTLRTTENMMLLVPWTLREAAFALGAPYYKVITQVVFRSALAGIITGALLSVARIAGETAPLLFTSFNNAFFTLNMNEPMPSLTVTIFQYATGPYEEWHKLAYGAAFVIICFILLVTLVARFILNQKIKSQVTT